MPPARHLFSLLAAALLVSAPSFAFDSPLSDEAVREAYFLGQRNDQTTASFFDPYFRVLPKPDKGPFISEVEIYTPYGQVIERSRRRSMGYSAQQAERDYRHHHDKFYVRVRIDFTETYGLLELYRSAKADQEQSGEAPLPDFYRDFRVGLVQKDGWIEPLRITLQTTDTFRTGHYPFVPQDLRYASYSSFAGGYYPAGWLVWLEYNADDVTSDDVSVEVITTDGQHVVVPFDLTRLR
jgi:hypothetical protein